VGTEGRLRPLFFPSQRAVVASASDQKRGPGPGSEPTRRHSSGFRHDTHPLRSLGFGARIVSGYLYNPDQQSLGSSDAGSTHAWAEIFVPGAGWITFDPTNRSVGGFNPIPVAVVRDIQQAIPVSGSFVGMTDAFAGMSVEVLVTS
jgi:Transglutaminase-like superfamily